MTLLRIGPAGIARSRFAISPLMETVGALIALHRGATPAWLADRSDKSVPVPFRAWLAGDDVAAGLLSLISATKFLPDTITPPPRGGMNTRLADELADVAAFSDDAIRTSVVLSVEASWQPQELAWLARKNVARQLAEALAEGWARFVESDWARRRAILERDVRPSENSPDHSRTNATRSDSSRTRRGMTVRPVLSAHVGAAPC